jgi:hypothetical protein
MDSSAEIVLRKTLTPNDVGATPSHQVGIHVPKLLVPLLPTLDVTVENPECWLGVESPRGNWRWRFIYYNKKLFGTGTRDEYRLLHTIKFTKDAGARAGDILEIVRTGPYLLRVGIRRDAGEPGDQVIQLQGPWSVVRVPSSRSA